MPSSKRFGKIGIQWKYRKKRIKQIFLECEFVQAGKNYHFRNMKMSEGLTMNASLFI